MINNKNILANGFALATAILWVFCSLFVYLFPRFSMTLSIWWLHGMELENLGKFNLNWNNFIWGGLSLIISFWLIGYVLGWSLEKVSKSK